MKKYTIYIWCFWFLLSGCGDFLEEQSQDLTYAVNCADLEELLVGNAYAYGLPASKVLTSAFLKSTNSKTGGYYFPGLLYLGRNRMYPRSRIRFWERITGGTRTRIMTVARSMTIRTGFACTRISG